MQEDILRPDSVSKDAMHDMRTMQLVLCEGDYKLACSRLGLDTAEDEIELRMYAIRNADEITELTYKMLKLELLTRLRDQLLELSDNGLLRLFEAIKGVPLISLASKGSDEPPTNPFDSPRSQLQADLQRLLNAGTPNANGNGNH